MKDPHRLIKIEKAIQKKYGDKALHDPRSTWNHLKEKEYLVQIKEIYKNEKPKEKIEVSGVLMPLKLFRKDAQRTCPSCNIYSKEAKDDMYMVKFNCCSKCYIQYVEGREEKWLKKMERDKNV